MGQQLLTLSIISRCVLWFVARSSEGDEEYPLSRRLIPIECGPPTHIVSEKLELKLGDLTRELNDPILIRKLQDVANRLASDVVRVGASRCCYSNKFKGNADQVIQTFDGLQLYAKELAPLEYEFRLELA